MSVGVVWSCCLVLCCGLCSGVGLCRGVVSSCVVVHHSLTPHTTHSYCTALNHTLAHTSPHYCFLTHKHSCTQALTTTRTPFVHLLRFTHSRHYLTPFLFTTLLYTHTLLLCTNNSTTLSLYCTLTNAHLLYLHTHLPITITVVG